MRILNTLDVGEAVEIKGVGYVVNVKGMEGLKQTIVESLDSLKDNYSVLGTIEDTSSKFITTGLRYNMLKIPSQYHYSPAGLYIVDVKGLAEDAFDLHNTDEKLEFFMFAERVYYENRSIRNMSLVVNSLVEAQKIEDQVRRLVRNTILAHDNKLSLESGGIGAVLKELALIRQEAYSLGMRCATVKMIEDLETKLLLGMEAENEL